jgi:hypothetical protein
VTIEDWLSLECGYLYPGVPKGNNYFFVENFKKLQ